MRNLLTIRTAVPLILSALLLNGCGALVVAGAGAAAGYVAYKEGYRVQSPVTRSGVKEPSAKEK